MKLEELIAAYEAGEGLDSLAEKAGVSRTTLTKRMKDHTKIRSPGYPKRVAKELGPEWGPLGKVPDTILAGRIGCSRQYVAKIRKGKGIPSFMETVKANARADYPDGTDDV